MADTETLTRTPSLKGKPVRGKCSGATGYIVEHNAGSAIIVVRWESGEVGTYDRTDKSFPMFLEILR